MSLASVPRPLQSMMPSLQRYSFRMECHKGSSLHIADTLLRAPLSMKSHRRVHDGIVYHTELEFTSPDLSGFQDSTLQNIITASNIDLEQIAFRHFIESGWANVKALQYLHLCTRTGLFVTN